MRPGELGSMRAQLRRSSSQPLHAPFTDDKLIGILVTLLRGQRPDIAKLESDAWIKARQAPESGPFDSDVIEVFKKELWEHLNLAETYGPRDQLPVEDQQQALDHALRLEWKRENHRFLAIPVDDHSHALNVDEIQRQLGRELPGVWPLYFGDGDIGLLLAFERGPQGGCRPWGEPQASPGRYRSPPPGTPLLLLSDLGCLRREAGPVGEWLEFGRQLAEAGLTPVVLQPVPRRHWRAKLSRYYRSVGWERGHGLPAAPAGGAPPPEHDAAVERLLTLLAPALSLEPALLRAARRLVGVPGNSEPDGAAIEPVADIGNESAAWQHPRMQAGQVALSYRPATARDYRQAFRGLDPGLKRRVLALIREHHGRQPLLARCDEELVAAKLCGDPADRAQALMRRVFGSADSARPIAGLAGLTSWLQRVCRRAQPGLLEFSPALEATWAKASEQALNDDLPLATPPGFDPVRVRWLVGGEARPRQLSLYQLGDALVAEDVNSNSSAISTVARLEYRQPRLLLSIDGQPGESVPLAVGTRIALPVGGERLVLATDRQRLQLESLPRPDWARRLGRDAQGLFAMDREGRRHTLDRPDTDKEIPDWADDGGEDGHGRWAEVRIEDIPLRLRWITPGAFWMGSPEDEPEHEDDETRHRVRLTHGYWLAETTVTQALWRAVMGTNPSRFKGEQLPVDSVSWEDSQQFISGLNQLYPGLALRLPTEAEWEYACRAGSDGPFWFGDNIDTGQVNYDGNYPYAGGDKGEYRHKTVAVKALPCNDWGLYQMHGNVREWCADWFGAYPAGPVDDPSGPETGARRVLRGGSWFGVAGWARSACRSGWQPDLADVFSGLRLARGPGQGR